MKRLIFALLLIASAADARTMVVFRKPSTVVDTGTYGGQRSGERFGAVARDVLDHVTGGQSDTAYGYTGVRDDQVTTEDVRNGQIVYGRGTPNPRVVQFDDVLTVGIPIANSGAGRLRLDSLFIANKNLPNAGGPRVPLGILFSDEMPAIGQFLVSCSACSTGASNSSTPVVESGNLVGRMIQKAGSTRGWYTSGLYASTLVHDTAREPAGGYRPLLLMNESAYDRYISTGVVPAWRDSAASWATDDSVAAWELPHGGFAASLGASPVVIAYADGGGGPRDSLLNWAQNNSSDIILSESHLAAEVDPSVIVMVLARLDSMTNHRVFDKSKLPIKLGVTVDGAFCRTTHLPGPGIRPSDSLVVKGTLDSLAALNLSGVKIKLTVGVNVDSMTASNARSELAWWRKMGGDVRFSPQPWRGVKTTATSTAGDGLAALSYSGSGNSNIVDMLGFRRSRFFKGDDGYFVNGATDDGDSSICELMKGARLAMVTAGVRAEEMSHTLLPALDDWSPANHNGGGTDMDSMLNVCRTCGGFSTIRSSNATSQSQPWRSKSSSGTFRSVSNGTWGYAGQEGLYKDVAGQNVKVLCGGWRNSLGAYRAVATGDSTTALQNFYDPLPDGLYAVWAGLTRTREYEQGDYHTSYPSDFGNFAYIGDHVTYTPGDYYAIIKDNWNIQGMWDTWVGSSHILTLSMADFSGRSGGTEANPARTGYYILKSLKNQFDTINDFAGRTVICFDWPEQITPAK